MSSCAGFPTPIDLAAKLALFDERWSPRLIAQVNDCAVKLVKLEGEFVWHRHVDEDELFLVLEGRLELRFRRPGPGLASGPDSAPIEHAITLGPGQLAVVPRGLEHLPVAPGGAAVLLFEPATTVNTGDAGGEGTVRGLERI